MILHGIISSLPHNSSKGTVCFYMSLVLTKEGNQICEEFLQNSNKKLSLNKSFAICIFPLCCCFSGKVKQI